MAQIIQPKQTWQESLGSGLGKGIQAGVTNLLEQKLQAMAQERQFAQRGKAIDALQKSGYLGKDVSPDVLEGLKYAPESTINTILKQNMTAPQTAAFQQAATRVAAGEPLEKVLQEIPLTRGQDIVSLTQAAANRQTSEQKIKENETATQLKQDAAIEAHNKPFETQLEKDFGQIDLLDAKVREWEQLMDSGKVASGFKGRYLTRWLQNKETQRFDQIGDEVAAELAGGAGSIAGIGKIRFRKNAKPSLDLDPGAQRAGIAAIRQQIDHKKAMRNILYKMREANGFRPIEGEREKFHKIIEEFDKLPNPRAANFPKGTIFSDKKTKRPIAKVVNGQWQPV